MLLGLLEAGLILTTGQTVDLQNVQKVVQPELEVTNLDGFHKHVIIRVTDVGCHDFFLAGEYLVQHDFVVVAVDVEARDGVDDEAKFAEGKHENAKEKNGKLEETTDVRKKAEKAIWGSSVNVLDLVEVDGMLSQNPRSRGLGGQNLV